MSQSVRIEISNAGTFNEQWNRWWLCPVCGEEVNGRRSWLDPYNDNLQVHYDCLSDKRKAEVEK